MAEEINEPEEMFQSWDGKPIYAKKAERDVNGNLLELTIENDKVTKIGGVSVGGGGEPYTRATVSFGNVYTENNENWQNLNVQNNTYSSVDFTNLDENTQNVKIILPSGTDFPMCVVKFDNTSWASNVFITELKVYNGSNLLRRLYPLQITTGEAEIGEGYGPIGAMDIKALMNKGGYMEVHILGDSYTVLSNIGPCESPGSV